MITIHKYVLDPDAVLDTHQGAELLAVGAQGLDIVAWFRVDTDRPLAWRRLVGYGTGRPIDPAHADTYAGTVQRQGDGLVFHIFDLGEVPYVA
jgi:hypothetical protein